MKPKSPRPRDIITLADLIPKAEIKGGGGKRVFGAAPKGPPTPAKAPAKSTRDRK
jgi:hypothetical protein